MQKILGKLNPAQQSAVRHKNGPLLILAGAGSGKTTTMASRIAYLIAQHNISAENILGLSFTRKAADELRERVFKMVKQTSGSKFSKGLTLSTFHALCVKILRLYAEDLGFSKTFSILDEADQGEVIKSILKQIKFDDRKFDIETIRAEISFAKNRFLSPLEARSFFLEARRLPEDYAIITCNVYEHYQERLRTLNSLDFDDLLFYAVTLLEKSQRASDYYNAKFRYILVDEYQDTNPAQFRLLSALTKNTQNLCVVGDDDQSIYSWRGADPTHILEFSKHFAGAELITLDQNYRSTENILEAANEVISKNTVRHPKRLWSEKGTGEPIKEVIVEEDRAEATMVGDEILHLAQNPDQPRAWKDFAILFRSNPQSRVFEEALRMRKIPYKIVGTLSYLERKEVRDSLSYLRLIQNPKDDASFRRIINYPARSIGKTTIDTLNTEALAQNVSLFEAATIEGIQKNLTPKAREALAPFCQWVEREREELSRMNAELPLLCDWIRRMFQKLNLRQTIFDEEDNPKVAERKWENVEELVNALGQMKIPEGEAWTPTDILTEFLSTMTLDPKEEKDDKDDQPRDEVTLLTLHGSKGLEYPIVFLVGLEEGLLPHKRTLEEGTDLSEERRLCYVGITRAKEKLILTRCRTRIRYGKAVPRLASRFLADIPRGVMMTQDESLGDAPSTEAQQNEHEVRVKDFMSRLRAQIAQPKT